MAQVTELKANALPGKVSNYTAKTESGPDVELGGYYYYINHQGTGMGLQKNVASQKVLVFAFNTTTNAAVLSDAANITGKVRKDFGSATAITDTNPTEIEDGYYEFDLSQSETNANVLDILPESSTSNVKVIGVPTRIFTVPSGFSGLITDIATIDTNVDAILVDTADMQPKLGTPAADISADIAAVKVDTAATLVDTAVIGALGAGLTAIPWNAAWDTEVQSEVTDALNAYDPPTRTELTADKDELITYLGGVLTKGTADSGTTTTLVDAARTEADSDYWAGDWLQFTSGTISGQTRLITGFNAATDTITFAPATTQAVGTNTYTIIPAANINLVNTVTTLTGHTAQTGDSYARIGATGSGLTTLATASALSTAQGNITDILADTAELQGDWVNGGRLDLIIDAIRAVTDALPNSGALTSLATAAEVAKIPKSDSTVSWNATALASINAQVLDVLNTDTFAELTAIPAAATTLTNMIRMMYHLSTNKLTETADTLVLRNRADNAQIAQASVTDDGTTAVRGSMI